MKGNSLAVTIGGILLFIFGAVLFCFQVRQTEVAFVSTFGRASTNVPTLGLNFKLPWPIQRVHKFDARVQTFEGKFEEALTSDGKPLMVQVYLGWKITHPQTFNSSFGGSTNEATRNLEGLIGSSKNAVIGRHPFGHFVSTDAAQLKFVEIEQEMLGQIKSEAQQKYGISVEFLGIKRLGLPETIVQKVFERMKAERERLVQQYQGEGMARSIEITAIANRERDEILAKADGEATRTMGQAEADAAVAYQILERNPELANYLKRLDSLVTILKDRSTLVVDTTVPPFDVFRPAGSQPMPKSNK